MYVNLKLGCNANVLSHNTFITAQWDSLCSKCGFQHWAQYAHRGKKRRNKTKTKAKNKKQKAKNKKQKQRTKINNKKPNKNNQAKIQNKIKQNKSRTLKR